MFPWQSDIQLSPEQVQDIAREQLGFSCDKIEPLGEGWDYINFLADGHWVLRFPKRADAERALLQEKAVLDLLNVTGLPLEIPNFELFGKPGDLFERHFALYKFLQGEPLLDTHTRFDTSQIPSQVGEFLSVLHTLDIDPIPSLWEDEEHDDWMTREFEGALDAYPDDLRDQLKDYLQLPPPAEPSVQAVLAHADLGPEHILVNPAYGRATAIIDWGDAHTTVRTVDYAGLYYLKGKTFARLAFDQAAIVPSAEEWRWLQHAAIGMAIGQTYFGWNDNRPALIKQANQTLTRELSSLLP